MFSFNTEHYHSKNNINDIAPGESVKVKVAFFVDEDMMDNAYIELMPGMTEKEGNVYITVGE